MSTTPIPSTDIMADNAHSEKMRQSMPVRLAEQPYGRHEALQSGLTIVSLIALIVVLYLQFQTGDPAQVHRMRDITQNLAQLNAEMEKYAVLSKTGLTVRNTSPGDAASQFDSLILQAKTHAQTIQDSDHKSAIHARIADLERSLEHKRQLIKAFLSDSTLTMLDGEESTTSALAAISAIPSSHHIELLDMLLVKYIDELALKNAIYRTLMLMLSVVLLGYAIDFIVRLRRKTSELRAVINELDYQKFAMDQHAIVIIFSPDNRITYVNDKFCEISGYTRKDMIGQPVDITCAGRRTISLFNEIKSHTGNGSVWRSVEQKHKKDGGIYWTNTTVVPFNDSNGRPYQYVSISSDISAEKETEQALQVSETRYRSLIEHSPSAISVHQDGKWVYANFAAMRLFGTKRPEEIIGRPVQDFFPPDQPSQSLIRTHDDLCDSLEEPVTEEVLLGVDGIPFETEMGCIPVVWKEKPAIMMFAHDISDRKYAERELGSQRMAMKAILDHAPISIWMLGIDRKMKFTNKCFNETFGLSEQQTLAAENYGNLFPADVARYWRNSDESCFENREIKECLQIQCPGGKIHSFEIVKACVEDEQGKALGLVGLAIDATERIEMEKEQQEISAQMEHMQRLESLGVLAGGIAHDFNNILTAIMGNASLAEADLAEDSPTLVRLRNIESGADRAADLCKQMLAYSGKGLFIVEPVNMSMLTREMASLLSVSISKNVTIEYRLDPDIPAIKADASQIQQIIMNLIINASEAIGEDTNGVITVSSGTIDIESGYYAGKCFGEPLHPGRHAYLETSDTGCGMTENILVRIFDPFFSTKFTGRGLGMSAVLGIVRSHRGALVINSDPGKGSTFRVLIPCMDAVEPAASEKIVEPKNEEWHGTGCVLVIDDEESIRSVASTILCNMGYSVLTASDGLEGVDLLTKHRGKVKAVLLDMTMPKMNGLQCFRQIKRIAPEVKVVLSSGYDEQDATKSFDPDELDGFLPKPYPPELLKSVLHGISLPM